MTVWRVVRYWLYIVHRWLGIFACLLFVGWFVSGLVMSYVGYPEAQPARRYQALQPIDWTRVRLDPNGLLSYLRLRRYPREVRLEMLFGEPVYRVIDWDGSRTTVSAQSGERAGATEPEQAVTIAETYAHARGELQATISRDQWTVSGGFNVWRPLHRIAMDDAAGTEVYVSAKTGEVVLATTRAQRSWNWLGAIPHWIYFTPLRANQQLWRQVVMWASAPGILLAVTGIWIGILRLRTQYRGWKNWHQWSGIDGADLPIDFAQLVHQSARTVRFFHVDGMPIAALVLVDGTERLVDARTGARVALTDDRLIQAAHRLMPESKVLEHRRIEAYDSYWYAHHDHPPLPVLRVAFDDPQHTWYYIDPATGLVLDLLDDGGRRWRWWFNALHRLDFRWLVQDRVVWHATVWVLCLAGLITSASGTVIGWRRLRRKSQAKA
ncbi:MAG TPA: hypothetical protein VJT80_23800 [Steroidobacteraceae bacterium]|nr:hypothetical protein [Steroidobacteraceae bacterium]